VFDLAAPHSVFLAHENTFHTMEYFKT
jgi:hypothetical protein